MVVKRLAAGRLGIVRGQDMKPAQTDHGAHRPNDLLRFSQLRLRLTDAHRVDMHGGNAVVEALFGVLDLRAVYIALSADKRQ